MSTGPNLEFRGLTRAFGPLRVLSGISGSVAGGEVLEVTGGNGSGKSTLLRCLAGLLAPDGGTIECRVGGERLDIHRRRRSVGYVAPDLAFYGELTTLENLAFFARLKGAPAGRAEALLERVGLPLDRPDAALSSGMRQRLRWCWAVLAEPPILLLDEPFQNLDAAGVEQLRGLLDEHLERGLAVIANPAALELPRVTERIQLDG